MTPTPDLEPMTLEEARAIVAGQDSSSPARAVQAVAMVLRFSAISEPRLLGIAATLETLAGELPS